jgi:hypothetical protein
MAANAAAGRLQPLNATNGRPSGRSIASPRRHIPTVTYPNGSFGLALRTVAGAIVRGIGSRVFWVQTSGFDTHAQQGASGGAYGNLMGALGDGLLSFYSDVRNQGLANDTTVIVFSEFGRRISENGSRGTDHGAAGVMMALGGMVRGGLYGTAASLAPGHPTLENSSGDVRYETDFRSVYARLLDQWLGVNSVPILNGDFRASASHLLKGTSGSSNGPQSHRDPRNSISLGLSVSVACLAELRVRRAQVSGLFVGQAPPSHELADRRSLGGGEVACE